MPPKACRSCASTPSACASCSKSTRPCRAGGSRYGPSIRNPEARDRALEHGLEPVPSGTGDNARLFLGLVATNSTDGVEVIEFFEPERERFLEYDISRLVWSLMNPDPPVVGVMSRLDITERYNPSTREPIPAWAFLDRIKEFAEVREVDTPTTGIDPEIDVLMRVHPRDYRERVSIST